MVTKEIIKSELDKVPEECLEAIYEVVKFYSSPVIPSNGGFLLSKLKQITINGPEDFSENLDLYLSGEKTIG
jgi:ABC-type amino acid transport substrate-binding protein